MRRSFDRVVAVVAAAVAIASATAAFGCRRKTTSTQPPPPPEGGLAAVATLPPILLEKFVAARAAGPNIEIAAVARDRTVVLSTLDPALRPIARDVLLRDVEATEGTEITLIGGGLVLLVAKVGGQPGAWLLRKGAAPLAIGRDRCATSDGVAWLSRDGSNVVVKHVRPSGETSTPPIAVHADSEVHLACGSDAITVTARDGEHLTLATMTLAQLGAPPALQELEREGELDDELRDRLILPRATRGVVVLRIGESSVSVRELDDAGSGTFRKVMRGGAPLSLRDDTDLVEAAAAPNARGRIFFLTSEEAPGSCGDDDPPRRIVLYDIEPKGDGYSATTRPVIELPCGVEAITAHLRAEEARATMWWTEPVDTRACTHPGLSASAVVTASTDRPGARRAPIMAEGIVRVDDARYLAVVRPGGCAPWAAPGAGELVLAPTPR